MITIDLARLVRLLQGKVLDRFLPDVSSVRPSLPESVDRPRAEFLQAANPRAIGLRLPYGLSACDAAHPERFEVESSWACR
jgi:hypothetical protein